MVGPGGQAGLGEQGLVPDDSQDLQRLLPGWVGHRDLVQNLWRETERGRPLVLNCAFFLVSTPSHLLLTAGYVLMFSKTICSIRFCVLKKIKRHMNVEIDARIN